MDPDRLRIAHLTAILIQDRHYILTSVAASVVNDGVDAFEGAHDRKNAQFFACRQLIVNEVASPSLLRNNLPASASPKHHSS